MGGLLPLLFYTLIISAATSVMAKIQIVDHGYEGVVVSICENVPENPDLLTRLESILTKSSKVLFTATRNQLYFKEFIITIPQSWQTKEHYESALDIDTSSFSFRIDSLHEDESDKPYTRLYGPCGVSQSYARLTPAFILKDKYISGQTIVHEWGHLRWGLFNEFVYQDEGRDKPFYRHGVNWVPTICTHEIPGFLMDYVGGGPCNFDFYKGTQASGTDCSFFLNESTKATAIASLMSVDDHDDVVEFCDNHETAPRHLRHDNLAPNPQNRLCDHKSAWEVMRTHSDFISLSNKPALPKDTDTRPKFRYTQLRPRKQVLVLDVSGSMSGEPLNRLVQVASGHILTTLEEGSQVGIVQFSNYAQLLSNLVQINSENDRDLVIDTLPNSTLGSTSIGAGLSLGMEVLLKDGPGGSILLITDGEENEAPYIEDIKPMLLEKGIPVHAFAMGQSAENAIRDLAKVTGGKLFFESGNPNSTALMDGFSATVATTACGTHDIFLSILTDATVVTASSPVHNTFVIDSTIGRETHLTFSYTEPIKVEIESPYGPYKGVQVKDLPHVQVLKITLEDDLAPGRWSYRVTTQDSSSITVNVQSKPRYKGADILQVNAWIMDKDVVFDSRKTLAIYAEILLGPNPVVGASVLAKVERPNLDALELFLKDDGLGSDIIKGDGIYTGNIVSTDLTGDGRYNIKIQILGTKGKVKEVVGRSRSAGGALDHKLAGTPKRMEKRPLGEFQRVTTAGEFHVVNFSYNLTVDELPPAKITDLDAKSFNLKTLAATLAWTAVGGDMERGRASQYIIYIADDLRDILQGDGISAKRISQEDVVRGNLSLPSPSGAVEEFVVHVKSLGADKNKTVFLSVAAIDGSGNTGKHSNVVSLSRAEEFSVPAPGLKRIEQDSDSGGTPLAMGLWVTLYVKLLLVIVLLV